jgi:hypothetical protein
MFFALQTIAYIVRLLLLRLTWDHVGREIEPVQGSMWW